MTLPQLTQVPDASIGATLPIIGGSTLGLGLNTAPITSALNGVVDNVNANIVDQLSNQPLDVRLFGTNGALITAPSGGCSVAVRNPNGITLGGGRIDGLGGSGLQASAGDVTAIAIGNDARTTAGVVNAIAFGAGARASIVGGVALGSGSVADRLNAPVEAFTGTGLRPTLGVASIGAVGDERQLTNVAGGTAETDAVNVRQLRTVGANLATSLGGGAAFDPATGAYTAPTYTVQGTGYGNVGSAIGALDTGLGTTSTNLTNLTTNINNGTIGIVQQDPGTRTVTVGAGTDGTLVSVAGTSGNRQIRGLAAGTGATDAVNVTQLTTAISGVAPGALAVASENSAGAPAPTATGLRSVAVGYGSTATAPDTFSVGAAGAERRLVNVAAGTVAAGSTDGVNGGQLFTTRQGVQGNVAALGGGAAFDATTGVYTTPTFTVQGTGYTNVGGAIGALDTGLGTTTTNLTNLTTNINNGTIGLVQQDPGTRTITVGAGTDGTLVSVAGTAGTRQIRGLTAGTAATDAVNVSQLSAAISGVAPGALAISSENSGGAPAPTATGLRSVAVGYGSTATAPDTFSVGAAGAERRLVNVAAGTVAAGSTDGVNAGQLFSTRQGVQGNVAALGGGAAFDATTGAFTAPTYSVQGTGYTNVGGAVGALDTGLGTTNTNLTNLTTNINNGTIGLVRQDPGTRTITVGAATDGSLVSVAGTSGNRQIRGVAAGTGAGDAVNVTQLTSAISGVAPGALAISSENSGGAAPPTATGLRSVAVGYGSTATVADTFSVGTSGAERRIVNVAPGTLAAGSTDAVTGGQLFNAVSQTGSDINLVYQRMVGSLGGGAAYNPGTGVFNFPNYTIRGTAYNNAGSAFAAVDTALGQISSGGGGTSDPIRGNSPDGLAPPVAAGNNSVAGGYQSVAGGTSSTALGDSSAASGASASSFGAGSVAMGDGSSAIGTGSQAMASNTTAIGTGALADFNGSTAIGSGARAIADPTTAVGFQALASGNDAVAVGANSAATGDDSTSVGAFASATGTRATALGRSTLASGTDSVAIGQGASAEATNAVAIGQGASAGFANSVALGADAVASRPNQIAIGSTTNTYTLAGLASAASNAAQSGPTRYVTTDVAGNLGTTSFGPDAIEGLGNRVNDLGNAVSNLARAGIQARREARSGIASAMAMTSAPMPSMAGKTSWAMNTASFKGEWAGGVAVAHRLDTPMGVAVTGGISYGASAGTGVRVGLAGEF